MGLRFFADHCVGLEVVDRLRDADHEGERVQPDKVTLAPGYEIPRIVNGCWQLARDHRADARREDDSIADLVRLAERGLVAYDCADIYTGVETRLGAFRRAWAARGGDVGALRIHTKLVPDLDALPAVDDAYVLRILDRSRRRLGMDRLDLVQLHWWDFRVDGWVETARRLDDARAAGGVRHLGVTNFDAAHLEPILDAGVRIVSNQVQYSLLDRRPAGAMTALCRERGISLLTYGALAGGFLTDRWLDRPDPGAPLPNRSLTKYRLIIDELGGWDAHQRLLRLLDGVARKHGVSIANVAVRWVLDRPRVAAAIVGAADAAHVDDNLRVFDFALDDEDRAAIDGFLAGHPGPAGEVYSVERVAGGRHAAIMKTGLNRATQPDHRVALGSGEWACWRRVLLRSAGFPAEAVRRLSFPEVSAAADRLVAEDGLVSTARRVARRARDRAAKDALATAEARRAARRADFDQAYRDAVARQSKAIFEIAGWERFREAVVWQNRNAFRHGVERIRAKPPETVKRNRSRRVHEEIVAKYLQRYCVKNDTIGFFGPQCWARLVDDGPAVALEPGPALVAARAVYLEAWGLREVARALEEAEPAIRRWLAPRRLPAVAVRDGVLHVPGRAPTPLEPAHAALLDACDGERTAREIARALVAGRPGELASEAEVYRVLDAFAGAGCVAWSFEVPAVPHADRILRRQLERVGDRALRRRGLAALDELERRRAAVERSAGDAEALDRAIGALESSFVALTGAGPTRLAGKTYAGRTLVCEDTLRDVRVAFGPELLAAAAAPLELVLASVRWATFRVAQAARERFARAHAALAREARTSRVDGLAFWRRVEPWLAGERDDLERAFLPGLHRRWAELLDLDDGERRVARSSADLRARVAETFAAPGPGWTMARHHNPDVMIAAASVEALRRGDYELVLGELHMARNTLNSWALAVLDPEREAFRRHLDLDFPEPIVVIRSPRDVRLTTRTQRAHRSRKDFEVPPLDGAFGVDPERAIPVAELVIEPSPAGLVARTRDGRMRFDVVELFGDALSRRVAGAFSLLPDRAHRPRVRVDRMVVQRESWRFAARDVPIAGHKRPADRFLAARAWRAAHGFPSTVFVKTPVEAKPFYVDFDSPISVELLTKLVRKTRRSDLAEPSIALTEMLPGLDRLWLEDAAGKRYTSELRVVVYDRRPAAVAG